jgi:phosphate transport system permease protein
LTAHIALVVATDTQDAAYASIFAAGLILLFIAAAASLTARRLGRRHGRTEAHRAARG